MEDDERFTPQTSIGQQYENSREEQPLTERVSKINREAADGQDDMRPIMKPGEGMRRKTVENQGPATCSVGGNILWWGCWPVLSRGFIEVCGYDIIMG